jgi:hypothetical protein
MRKPVAVGRVKIESMLSALYGKNMKSILYRVSKDQEIKPGEVCDIVVDGKSLGESPMSVYSYILKWLIGFESKYVKVSIYRDSEGVYGHEFELDGHDVVIKLEKVID